MKRVLYLAALYCIGALLLCCVDVTYGWASPLVSDGSVYPNWYSFVGLWSGFAGLGSHEGPASGLVFSPHFPAVPPFPFYVGAGPEGGATVVSIWFIALLAACAHILMHSLRSRRTLEIGTRSA